MIKFNNLLTCIAILFATIFFSCKKEKGPEPATPNTTTPTPVTFNMGLIEYYSLNGNVNSYTTTNGGTVNGATSIAGVQDSAYFFNGTSDNIDLGNNVGSGIRTISLWFNTGSNIDSTLLDAEALIYRNDATQTDEFGIYIGPSAWGIRAGRVTFSYKNDYIVSDTNSWTANTWHHVVAVINPSNGMKMYVDGILQNDSNSSNTVAIQPRAEITTLGTWGDASIRYFNGGIDEVYLWNRALSLTEVLELYNLTVTLD